MVSVDYFTICFSLMFIRQTSTLSYNQPKFCPNASWDPNAITFADSNIVGSNPLNIFITTNNTIYVPNRINMYINVWSGINLMLTRNISLAVDDTYSIFVTEENDIYFDYTLNSTNGIGKLTSNLSSDLSIVDICFRCYDVFVDILNHVYCSVADQHQVVKRLLNNVSDPIKVVAGTGNVGSGSYMLNSPQGLFVDTNLDLYVADYFNDRVQLFPLDQSNGITVAGNGSSPNTIILTKPTGIILDADKYVFVVDHWGHRIVGSGPYGFRCLVGCSGGGSAANQLYNPQSMSFDTFGNIFVVDQGNNRTQKFTLITNSCNETTASPTNNVTYFSNDILNISTVNTTNGITYNQPKLDPYAVWNPNGITFANINVVGSYPYNIIINKNNTIYVVDGTNKRIQIWMNDDIDPTTTIYATPIYLNSIFVTTNGDIYTNEQYPSYQVNKWTLNTNNSAVVMYVDHPCYGLFVNIKNILYCAIPSNHKVVTKSLTSATNILTIVAGTGCGGSTSNTLNTPYGIFVDINLNLYVADSGNNRIQLFPPGVLNGITVAGSASSNVTITLYSPMSITLDIDNYLFISDSGNNRIVGSGPNGFRCIVGCTESGNVTSNTLFGPNSMTFDTYGNIYVADYENNRIQKFLLLNNTLIPSYNQPTFCSNATWNPNGITFANMSVVGLNPYALFININDTIYIVNKQYGEILVWLNNSISFTLTLYYNITDSKSIFVTTNGDIYVDNGNPNGQVDKITSLNASNSTLAVSAPGSCYGLFIDITNTLYCSVNTTHQVFKIFLDDNMTTLTAIAGNGVAGSTSNMLWNPSGIFVDTNFDLYVADSFNNRIQLFRLGNSNGITVAGVTSINTTIILNCPSDVILDENRYLFIADTGNNRIIRSDENGFHCIVGCTGSPNSTSNTLNNPRSIAFDSFGNLFVTDTLNHRIQKFIFLTASCNKKSVQKSTLTSTIKTITHQTSSRITNFPIVVPFFSPNCSSLNIMSLNCNISSDPCYLLNPCQNEGTCVNTIGNIRNYLCTCKDGFDGDRCQYDHRLCKPNTCWNNGSCHEISNTTYNCFCQSGWTGNNCEMIINYCDAITCENNGVCQSIFMNYTCKCLGESFSGRHCEKVATSLVIHKILSKSVAYVAIIIIISFVAFIVIMDILKYRFGIHLAKPQVKAKKKTKHRPVMQRFIYVIDASHLNQIITTGTGNENKIINSQETRV